MDVVVTNDGSIRMVPNQPGDQETMRKLNEMGASGSFALDSTQGFLGDDKKFTFEVIKLKHQAVPKRSETKKKN